MPPPSVTCVASVPRLPTATTWAPARCAPAAIDSVSSVSPEYESANTRLCGPTNAGVRYCLSTDTGTGSEPLATAASTSPAIPDPPMPSTTTLRTSSAAGSAERSSSAAASCAAASCSGNVATASRKPSESVISARPLGRPRPGLGVERRADALGGRQGDEALVLGVVDRLGLVHQHDRDVVTDGVPTLQTRVVERALTLEVEQRTLVVGARQDLEQLRVEGHVFSYESARMSESTSSV